MAAIVRSVCGPLGATAICLPLMLMAAGAAIGAPGDLDPTFGNGGRVFINMDENAEAAASLVQQSDGKLLLGRATNFNVATSIDLSVVRLNPDGMLDTGFGGDGMASTNLPGITASTQVVVQQASGKIIVAGPAWTDDNQGSVFFAIARYLADGALDVTFGSGGYMLDSFGATSASITALVAQPDGRLVAAGYVERTPGVTDTAFTRLNADGSIDATFGHKGRLIMDLEGAGRGDIASALLRSSDGRLIAAGMAKDATDSWRPFLLALTADGVLDASFGVGGRAMPDINGEVADFPQLGLQSDGKIVLTGIVTHDSWISCELLVARIDETGHPDPGFGTSGLATLPLSDCYVAVNVIVTSDDHILIGRAPNYVSPWDEGDSICGCDLLVTRLTANGARDDAFGVNGTMSIDLGVYDKQSNLDSSLRVPLVQQADGQVVVAPTGVYDYESSSFSLGTWSHNGIAVARLLKSGGSPGLIGFREANVSVPETQPSAVLYVRRTGGAEGVVSVEYTTSDLTAHAGQDYAGASGTLTWADGDRADKAITIAITDDTLSDCCESLEVTLSSPTGGAFLATSLSRVTIEDNDPAPAPAPVPVSIPPPAPTPVPGSSSSGGGGAMDWVQLLALALVLVAAKRRGRPSIPGYEPR